MQCGLCRVAWQQGVPWDCCSAAHDPAAGPALRTFVQCCTSLPPGSRWADDEAGSDDGDQQQQPRKGKPSWAAAAAEASEEEEDGEAARRRAEAAAAAKQRAIMQQLKEQLTNILLEVTDKMFGEWGRRWLSSGRRGGKGLPLLGLHSR